MTFVTRSISALRAIFLPVRLAKHLSHPVTMRSTGSIDVKYSAAPEESALGLSCKSSRTTLSRCILAFVATISLAHAADSDSDGLDDSVETNTGVYVSALNTGTDPTKADTDGDGVPDGLEVKEKTSPVDATKFNSFSKGLVAYYPLDKSGADETGSGYNGNFSNSSLESVDGTKVLKAISNSPSGILIPNGGQLPLPATGWAISGWIKCIDFSAATSPNGYFTLYESGDISGSQQSAINLSYSAHGLNLQITGYDDYPSNTAYLQQKFYRTNDATSDTLRAGQWHHIMVVVSGSKISAYVDGNQLIGSSRGSSSWSGQAPKRTARAAGIGLMGQGGSTPNKSYIKNIRIYERSLAFWEVLNLFHSDRTRFQVINGLYTWDEAKHDAELRGGHLATFFSEEEWNDAQEIFPSNGEFWLGASDSESEGFWKWIDGTPWAFSKWSQSNPDNASNQDALDTGKSETDNEWLWDDDWRGDYIWGTRRLPGYLLELNFPSQMVTVSGGTLPIGSELAGQTVETFQIGIYEVTWKEWKIVRDWALQNGYPDLINAGQGSSDDNPVRNVSWHDVVKWCNAKSEREGLTPVYYTSSETYKTGHISPTIMNDANGYRLPLEKEWEWAAQGGAQSQGFNYSGSNDINRVAWFYENSIGAITDLVEGGYTGGTWPVGLRSPNELGIFDMSGSMFEWCWDTYSSDTIDRIIRGGSWFSYSPYCQVYHRLEHGYPPTENNNIAIGFRLARNTDANAIIDLVMNFSSFLNGNINGSGKYNSGTPATITAVPNPGYRFTGWTGDASGIQNPLTIMMDADKTVGATFDKDLSDADNDGLTAFDELVTYQTNPNLADTDGDGINDGAEVQQGRSPSTAEPVITNVAATQRTGTKFFDITYDLTSTTPTVKMSLEISSDGGATYTVPVTSATGAIGEGVTVGNRKSIVWNAGVDWNAKSSSQMRFRLIVDNQVIEGLSLIPAGAFTMGRTSGDTDSDAPPVNVTVSSFYMGKYEVTKSLWDEVRTWAVTNGYTDLAAGAGKAANHPVHTVSWWDAIKWCNARSEKEGLTPCYTVSGSVMKTGTTEPTVNWTANGYRLPTEAEWEKAARGGVSGKRFPWGTDTISYSQANYRSSTSASYDESGTENNYHPTYNDGTTPYTSPVGSFAANAYGLDDMAGNVREWCWDWYGSSTYVNGATDPRGAASGSFRVRRGGSWWYGAFYCRAAVRYSGGNPAFQDGGIGFRVARGTGVGALTTINSTDTNLDTRMWTLTTSSAVNGNVSGAGSYLSQTSANLTATPSSGYLFGSWSGDTSGTSNPTTLLMDANKTVGATFVEDTRDPDGDGLTNYQEIIIRLTNPNVADTDNDGVNDGQEVSDTTNPLVADTDGDGLNDGDEKARTTNPLVTDTDGDTYGDGYEVQFSSDPKSASSFPTYTLTLANNGTALGGTFTKSGTLAHGTNATLTAIPLSGYLFGSWSGNASGTSNPTTVLMNANKSVGASFVQDTRDPDTDGLTNYQEIIIRLTNPDLADTDNDGVNDGQEVTDATNPLTADTDADGLNDGEEKTQGTNPLLTDTDSDGYSDSYEVENQSDPKTNESFPTYTLTLTNNGTVLGGTFAKSGTLAHGTNATLTATALPGYLFGSWSGDASGTSNPTAVLMDSDKTVGATFVEDTRDPDGDGLTNYQEIIIRLTNPNVADTDNDGVNDGQEVTDTTNPLVADTDGDGITDGEEKTRTTNPLLVDTDGDGLGDLQEITISKTNPLLSDTNGNGISDALEDSDNDGILNGREIYQLGTNPLLADTNSNGLSDTYELLFQGSTDPFTPRVGDRVRYDLSRLGYQGTYKIVGTLPAGLTFNPITGILEGKLTGSAKINNLTIQLLNGKTVVRSIPLSIPVLAFPASLAGTWQALLENDQGRPEGLITVVVSSPGNWSATYDAVGTRTLRNAKGTFELVARQEQSSWSITFPAVTNFNSSTTAVTMSFAIDGNTALVSGSHARGNMRGFRLARGAELPAKTSVITMLIDQGKQDGFVIPAGMGWATGSISNRGAVALKGQLGDAQAINTTLSLGATGQALMWLKPYKNLNSYIGGIVSLHGSGVLPASPLHNQESELWWYRAADATELGYPGGFDPLAATVGVRNHIVPASSLALSQNLGLTGQVIRGVVFDGGGLPDPNAAAKLPESFAIDASYKMVALPIPGKPMAPWTGLIASRTGGFTGTLRVVASNSDTIAGNAAVSGVLFPTVGSRVVGAGLVKIPIAGPKGAFRTGVIVLGTEEAN